MKVLIFTANCHGPTAAATIPDEDNAVPLWLDKPGCPPAAHLTLMAKGTRVSWQEWAEHLTRIAPYAGRWTIEDVPEEWEHAPGLLTMALAQAQNRASLA
jgi:hypothetical protein